MKIRYISNKSTVLKLMLVMLVICLTATGLAMHRPAPVKAASLAYFNPGRIIDDSIFEYYNSMNVNDIQNFMNAKVPVCDTNGTQIASEYGSSLTHAQYAASQGWQAPPYTCLKNYSENGLSSAQIIYNAAQQYQINPQVLLVLLQKENGLVTDNWPLNNEYLTATGYGCPDSPGDTCQSQYYGFTNQIDKAAYMYHAILTADPSWYSPYVLGTNFIQYKPNTSCGGTNVDIVNRATQALYDYTPYQPNAAALAAGYGTGDGCSSYGNRNFYLYFNDWFGTTIVANLPGCTVATNTTRACIWSLYDPNGEQYLTSLIQVRDELNTNEGYQYSGIAFYGNAVDLPGNVGIYRASAPGGGSFITTSYTEYESLVSGGWTGDGVDFFADPPGANTGFPVYRLYNPTTYQHFWTTDPQLRQNYISSGWNDEGIAFTSISPVAQPVASPAGELNVYRFYIPQTYSHFYTTDPYERDLMIEAGYTYEGVAWYSYASTSDIPVYRLYSPVINQHLFTTGVNEKNVLLSSGAWVYEGISQYASPTPTNDPIYRLYAPSLGTHFWTSDAYERSVLLSSGKWVDEGIAWYAP
jgi:hypothetical protein